LQESRSKAWDSASLPGPVSERSKLPFGSREQCIAHNEDWCRDLNKRKAGWIDSGHPTAGFRCECWRTDCSDRFPLSGREWEEVRSRQNRFAVSPGHTAAEAIEVVVKEYEHFWVIEKRGAAGEVAKSLE
jgi:hypothetical protein